MTTQRVDSSVLNVPSEITKEIIFGPAQIQALQIPFDSQTNVGLNLNYQFAEQAIVTNDWYLEYSLIQYVTAPAGTFPGAGVPLFSEWGKKIAPRNFPLLWAMTSTTLRINNQVFQCQLKDIMPYISKCMSNEDALAYNDVGPALPDQGFFNYDDAFGTLKNVLGSYNDSRENWVPRGSWPYVRVGTELSGGIPNGTVPVSLADGSASGFVEFRCTTPYLVPPLRNPAVGVPTISLGNLYNINIVTTFDGNFAKCLSVPKGWTASSAGIPNVFGTSTNGNVQLLMMSSYAHDTKALPPIVKIPNIIYELKAQPVAGVLNNYNVALPLVYKPLQINSAIFQYDSYPDAFVFFVHKTLSRQVASDADVFLPLQDGFTMTINGDSQLLSGYTKSQLYQVCKKYARMDFNEFSGKVNANINNVVSTYGSAGPIYVIRPAIDIAISSETVVPNMAGYRIQMQFKQLFVENFSGTNWQDGDLELVVIAIRSGEVSLTPSGGEQVSNLVNKADVVSALTKEPLYTNEVEQLEGEARTGGKMKMTSVKTMRGSARSGGARSAGMIPVATAVPRNNTSRF